MIQPKPFLDKLQLRSKKEGNERRLDMSLKILEKGTPLPLPVEYKDIDAAMQKWVEEQLHISYEGEKLPTFRLFSNQRLNEYAETWQHLDENGNLLMNFKTITRDNNPQKGENQGAYANIPGNRDYPMFLIPVLQDNQQVAYDMFSMKQPFCVNLEYTINIITNKFELLNGMNELVHSQFKSITAYIYPNHHPMPMTLESVSDESEYSLDDRKYYSQTFKIKVKAYIIREEDFKITKLPSRITTMSYGDMRKRKDKEIEKKETPCYVEVDNSPYFYKEVIIKINMGSCESQENIVNEEMIITDIEIDNIYDFLIFVNREKQDLSNEIHLYEDDKLLIKSTPNDIFKPMVITIKGYNPRIVYDASYDPESSLDEQKINQTIIDLL